MGFESKLLIDGNETSKYDGEADKERESLDTQDKFNWLNEI